MKRGQRRGGEAHVVDIAGVAANGDAQVGADIGVDRVEGAKGVDEALHGCQDLIGRRWEDGASSGCGGAIAVQRPKQGAAVEAVAARVAKRGDQVALGGVPEVRQPGADGGRLLEIPGSGAGVIKARGQGCALCQGPLLCQWLSAPAWQDPQRRGGG